MTIADQLDADIVVAGGGIGGLMSAYTAVEAGARVIVLTGSPGASNFLQSMNTVLGVGPQDRPDGLFDDLLKSGGYINNLRMAAQMARRIGPETRRLQALGVEFSVDADDRLLRRQAAGSSWPRAVFSPGMVGVRIMQTLRKELADSPLATVIEGGLLVDVVSRDGAAVGGIGFVPKQSRWLSIASGAVVLATGGVGRLFGTTTNHPGSTAAGYGIALALGAELVDLEFVSFEPFVTCAPDWFKGRDLPTPVMNQGGQLVNARGERFLGEGALPSKDVVCRAMVREVEQGRGTEGGGVIYDVSGLDPAVLAGYVQLDRAVKALGGHRLEVMPAQHYLMGGVRTDEFGASTVPGLFAVGEAAGGAHGAHRLAGGGGTEVVALGAIVGESATRHAALHPAAARRSPVAPVSRLLPTELDEADQRRLDVIRGALDRACGIFRDGPDLEWAATELDGLGREMTAGERTGTYIGRCVLLARAMVTAAMLRTESRGDHFRRDFPDRDDINWLGNIRTRVVDGAGRLEFGFYPVGGTNGRVIDAADPADRAGTDAVTAGAARP